jgi:hypothetical protein
MKNPICPTIGVQVLHADPAVGRAKIKPGISRQFAERVPSGAVPIIHAMGEFKAFYMVLDRMNRFSV